MVNTDQHTSKIVIIGGGLSGVLLAINLCKIAHGPLVVLIEKDYEKLGRGNAYQSEFIHQPLNVVAGAMSIDEEAPEDFLQWVQQHRLKYSNLMANVEAHSFVPRKIFGDYLSERLKEALERNGGRLQVLIDEVISVNPSGSAYELHLASGAVQQAGQVVLALGNFPPGDVKAVSETVKASPRYFSNPWVDRIYSHIGMNDRVLLIGSSLTAIDIVLGLHTRRFQGNIHMISRKGKLPFSQLVPAQGFSWDQPYLLPPLALSRLIRKTIRENPGIHWTAVIDSIRPYSQEIWTHWSQEEKQLFLNKLRPFWEISRHRIPEETAAVLRELQQEGRLSLVKGEILDIVCSEEGFEVRYNNRCQTGQAMFHSIVNCTGPESNYRNIQTPVISSLMREEKLRSDALGLGILCDTQGRIINGSGQVSPGLWCMGPMRKAILWETTALREIRKQARDLAALLSMAS